MQRRVADQQARVGIGALGADLRLRHQHADERDRGRRGARDGDAVDRRQRQLRDQLHRLDGAVAADAERRQQDVALGVVRVLDARDVGDVELARGEHAVELGRDGCHLAHLLGVEVPGQRPLDREGVDERDAAEAQHQSKRRTTL